MTINTTSKYIAIKVQGIAHWLWFERAKTTNKQGVFTGIDGWGEGGSHTEITTDVALIQAEISSEALQYE